MEEITFDVTIETTAPEIPPLMFLKLANVQLWLQKWDGAGGWDIVARAYVAKYPESTFYKFRFKEVPVDPNELYRVYVPHKSYWQNWAVVPFPPFLFRFYATTQPLVVLHRMGWQLDGKLFNRKSPACTVFTTWDYGIFDSGHPGPPDEEGID